MSEQSFQERVFEAGVVSYMLGTAVAGITNLTSDRYLSLVQVYERHTHTLLSGIQQVYKDEAKRIMNLLGTLDSAIEILIEESILPEDFPIKNDITIKLIRDKVNYSWGKLEEFGDSIEDFPNRTSLEKNYQEICTELHNVVIWLESFYDIKFDEIRMEHTED